MNLQLDGQLALVSASTKGIGHAIARALAAEDARVIVNGRTAAGVDEAVQRILDVLPAARLEKFPGDLSQAAVADQLVAAFPAVDILINSLGIFDPKPFREIADAEWQRCGVRLQSVGCWDERLLNPGGRWTGESNRLSAVAGTLKFEAIPLQPSWQMSRHEPDRRRSRRRVRFAW